MGFTDYLVTSLFPRAQPTFEFGFGILCKSDRIYLVGNAAVYSQDKVNRLQGSDIEANSVKDKKCPKSAKIAERGSQTLCCHLRQIEFRQRQLQPRSKDKYDIYPKTNIL